MRCPKYERWISDRLDGALSGKNEEKLEAHLAICDSCRAFSRTAQRVQKEVKAFPAGSVPEGYWEESLGRLRAKLAASLRPEKKTFPAWGWRWAWLAAPLLLAVIVGILLFRQTGSKVMDEYPSAEERLGQIYSELDDSPDLEGAFNQVLESSIQEDLSRADEVRENDLENPLLYRIVSEEEMGFLLRELKKEIKS